MKKKDILADTYQNTGILLHNLLRGHFNIWPLTQEGCDLGRKKFNLKVEVNTG